jgi:RNA polymerase sigma-70 factor (ECF subfamily)
MTMELRAERFRRLFAPIHERVQAFSRGLCRSASDGDDLFQEASLRALTKLDALRDDGAFRTWLYRIVISVHRSRSRRAWWRRIVQLGDDGEVPAGERVVDGGVLYRTNAVDAGDATARAQAALARLPAVQREAIVLFELEGWQVEEIAALHGVSISAVKSRLARGRARLRAHYTRELGTGDVPAFARGESP